MDAIRNQLNKPLVIGILGVILGIILGLIWGYVIAPVEYYDAAAYDLRTDLQEEYMRMAIDSYTLKQDTAMAYKRFNDLGDKRAEVLAKIAQNPAQQDPAAIQTFAQAVQAGSGVGVQPTAQPGATQAVVAPDGEKPAGGSALRNLALIMCVITLVLALAVAAVFLFRGQRGSGTITPVMQAQEAARQAQWTDYETTGQEPPMAQYMASYKLGDDLFDDSFSIDTPAGEFLGECGVGISEPIGVGDPKKVTAFEVWLFDKNDIQTVTKVLMSAHAMRDETIHQRLSAKGEPVEAETGGQVVLETATLRLTAKIVDMNYGEGALPEKSFFDSLILEIAVWQK